MRLRTLFLLLVFVLLQSPAIWSQPVKTKQLQPGDKPPALVVQEWIKGKPVGAFEEGKIYVVEFSGTWCPPCRKAIPHLTEMAKKYADDVQMISVYNEHNDKEKPEDLSYLKKIHALVNAMGSKMDFTVAADVPQQTTQTAWAINGWPTAFVIDRSGHIAWKGHPMDLEPVLTQVIAGNFNAAADIQKKKDFDACLDKIRKGKKDGDYLTALKSLDSLTQKNPEKKTWLYYVRFDILAGDDDKKAYEWVQWIMDNKVEGFDWPHFVDGGFNMISPDKRNYAMELKALDFTIKGSETKYHAVYPLKWKAATHAKMKNYKAAIEASKLAIAYSQTAGGSKESAQGFETDLAIYQYLHKAQANNKNANEWLRQAVAKKQVTIDNRLIRTVFETGKTNYDLAIELIDKALVEAPTKISKTGFLSQKADVFVAMDSLQKAIACCEMALDISKEENQKNHADRYEKKLVLLKAKAGISILKAGDAAPELFSVRAWLKGTPVREFRKDDPMIYVLNFTGTWCPPCIKKLPHIAELQQQYAGKVRIINIFIENFDDDLSNIKRVRKLMEGLGEKIGANIVVDMPPDGRITWGNPDLSAFIVKAGEIIYRGHSGDIDPLLEKIVAGKFDAAVAQREQESYMQRFNEIYKTKREGDFATALLGINKLIEEAHAGNKPYLYYVKFEILAGNDDKAAYELLQWILDTKVQGFDWPHFVGGSFSVIKPENRNYEVEFRALDRTIETSETPDRKAYPLMLKAITYDKMGNYAKAVEMMQQSIKAGEEYGRNEDYENLLACLIYKLEVRENAKKANSKLRNEMKQLQLKHVTRWIDAVREAPDPDHSLTLELIEKALSEHPGDYMTAVLLRRKMSVYADMGNFAKAAEGARQTAEAWRKVASGSDASQKATYIRNAETCEKMEADYRAKL